MWERGTKRRPKEFKTPHSRCVFHFCFDAELRKAFTISMDRMVLFVLCVSRSNAVPAVGVDAPFFVATCVVDGKVSL